jgi:phosphomevalonate kinase
MMTRTLSAGGKVFLAGEYAVLWGGTARVAAVGPRVSAQVRTRDDRRVDLLLPDRRFSGDSTLSGVHWHDEVPDDCLFAARTLDLALRLVGKDGPGLMLALEASPQAPRGVKLGLGSSARTAVLTSEAARYAFTAKYDALKLALVAHAVAQGGKGSGADVAAIFAGGVVRYRRWDTAALVTASTQPAFRAALDASAPVDLWRLPDCKLPLAWAFSGASASTPMQIRLVESTLGQKGREGFAARSDVLGQQLESGLIHGDFAAARDAFFELEALLKTLGPIETEGIARIVGIAATYGCAAKISGAGGGDGCIIVCPDVEKRTAMIEGLAARDFFAMPMEIATGLKGEAQGQPELSKWLDAAS